LDGHFHQMFKFNSKKINILTYKCNIRDSILRTKIFIEKTFFHGTMQIKESCMKQIKLKIKKISAFGNSCNFCVTPNGLTNNVNEIEGHHLIVRMCDY